MSISNLDIEYLAKFGSGKVYNDGTAVLYISHPGGDRRKKEEGEGREKKKTARRYTIDRKRVRSACVELWKRKRGRWLLFLTVTFPGSPTEKQAGEVWEQFLHSLRETYGVDHYVWVKEFQKRGIIHYHILLDRQFLNIVKLQRTFNRICYNKGLETSNNSVRLGNKPRVFSVKSVKNYLSKYMSKRDDQERYEVFYSRAYAFSEFFSVAVVVDYPTLIELVKNFAGILVWECHFSEVYKLNDAYLQYYLSTI